MKKDKISIIVSAYNSENYIEKCITSILNQTYSNIELLIVDDASSDNTFKIIQKFEKKDHRIRSFANKKNQGAASSRNLALKEASGTYIGFIDSDDYIPSNYYETLLSTIEKNQSDIAVCDIEIVYEDGQESIRNTCGNLENQKESFIDNGLAASPCNKLYKREILKNSSFPVGYINEDIAFVIPLLVHYKLSYSNEVCYYYFQHSSSVQNTKITEKKFDVFKTTNLALEQIQDDKDYEAYRDMILFQQIILFFAYILVKEESIIKRAKWFKKFRQESSSYHLLQTKHYQKFIQEQGRKHQIYYQTLFTLNTYHLSLLASLVVSIHDKIAKKVFKNVIRKDISIDDLVLLAKKQKNLKAADFTISVVIPNYNYEKFLIQRIYSILSQTVKIKELIILDDCSKDESRKLIDKVVKNISPYIKVEKLYNTQNSGSAFKQWEKGFMKAQSDYVWIAEADDYCDCTFLEHVVKPIRKNKNIYLSYCDTAFINTDGKILLRTITPEIDIQKTKHWNHSYVNHGEDEFQNYSYLNCTIANVSSVLIKKEDYQEIFRQAKEYHQAGDWYFYVHVMRKGDIAYCNKALNYYRVHGDNVTSTTKKEAHLNEIKKVHASFSKERPFSKKQQEEISKRYAFLEEVWKINKR